MSNNSSVQTAIHDRIDPVLEAIMRDLVEARLHEAAAPQATHWAEPNATTLAQALLAMLTTPAASLPVEQSNTQVSPVTTALATALAASLAPVLAAVLAPAIVDALFKVAGTEKKEQEGASGEGSNQQ